jgi:hypothetical protein
MTVLTPVGGCIPQMEATAPMSQGAWIRGAHRHLRPLGRSGSRRRSLLGIGLNGVALGLLVGVYLLTALGTIVGDRKAKRDERCVNAQTDH